MSESSVANDGISGTPFERHVDGAFFSNEHDTVTGVNDRLVALTGFAREELVGQDVAALFDGAHVASIRQHAARARAGTTVRFALPSRRKDGSPLDLVLTLIASDEPRGLIGIARDAHALIEALEEPDANSISHAASRLARFSGWSIDVESGTTTWGEEMFDILGFDEGRAPDYERTLETFYEEPYRTIVERAVTACVEHGTPFDLQIKIRDLRGVELDARILGQCRRDPSGRVVRVEGAFYDITDVVRERDLTNASQREVANMFHNVSVPLFVVDRTWRLQYVNKAGLELAHLRSDDVGTVTIWDLFPEVEFNEMGRIYRAAMDEGRFGATVEHVDALDGDFEVVVHPTPEGIMLTARNVTSEREAMRERDELAERARALAQMLELTRDAVVVRDFDREVTFWNRAAEKLYGWSFEEVRGNSPLSLLYEETSSIEAALEVVRREGYWSGDLVQRTRDGRRVVVASSISLLRDASGRPTAFFGLHTDVTELRKNEEARIRAQRMESLGTLAGGVAHDINNVLTPMMMSLELLQARASDEHSRRLLKSMSSGVTRASQMVRQVLTFARGVEGERVVLSVRRLLDQVQEFCRDALPKNIDVTVDVSNDLGAVIGDETQLLQVLVNLVTNARDAMLDGGSLRIRARNVTSVEGFGAEESPRHWVSIMVSDSGEGMSVETQARVFEPFFTTKEFGDGTGLGLSTSSAIVESHGGRLSLESELARGTTFTLELPCELNAATFERAPAMFRQGNLLLDRARHLLIIDDEEEIVTMVRDVLADSGYDVDAVTSSAAALALVRDAPTRYDLILTDVNMPKLSGPQFAAQATRLGVSAVIAFMSGVSDEWQRDAPGERASRRSLAKPFTVTQLLDFVDEALSAAR